MSLQPGKYYISSMAVNGGRKISRYWVEDMSLHPKRVILLPEDSKVPDHWKPEWIIEKSDDSDSYIMKSRHSYTVNHNGNLLAILSPDFAPPQTWKITPQPMHGSNVYTIEAIDSSVGWVVPSSDDMTQVAVRPLIVFLTLPPTYPPSELFKIERID